MYESTPASHPAGARKEPALGTLPYQPYQTHIRAYNQNLQKVRSSRFRYRTTRMFIAVNLHPNLEPLTSLQVLHICLYTGVYK